MWVNLSSIEMDHHTWFICQKNFEDTNNIISHLKNEPVFRDKAPNFQCTGKGNKSNHFTTFKSLPCYIKLKHSTNNIPQEVNSPCLSLEYLTHPVDN